jgi:hypothetical protein
VLLNIPAFVVALDHREPILSVEKLSPSAIQGKESPTDACIIIDQAALALDELKEETHARPRVGLFPRMGGSRV